MKLDDRRAAGQLQEMINTPDLNIKGRVAVDILNERGRVIDRQEADNYVNQTLWERYAKWAQRVAWTYGMTATPGVLTKTSHNQRDPRVAPALPAEHVVCWTDNTAEDTLDIFPEGSIVAWAHRWGQGTPSIRQGLVNPLLCELSEDEIKWVWEWTTTNGNGTFQSVGWRRLWWSGATGTATLADYARYAGRLIAAPATALSSVSISATMVGSAYTYVAMPMYYNSDDGRMYWNGPANHKLFSNPVTFSAGGFTMGAVQDDSASAIATGLGGNTVASSTLQVFAYKRLSPTGDWIAVGSTGAANANRRAVIRRVTPAGAVTWSNANAATFAVESCLADVTYDGTDIYAVGYHAGTGGGTIYRIDPATGTVSATISVSGTPDYFGTAIGGVGFHLVGIEWDATRGVLWLTTYDGRILTVNTSGVWQGVLLNRRSAAPTTLTLASPNTGDTANFVSKVSGLDWDWIRITAVNDGGTGTLAFNNAVITETELGNPAFTTQKLITMDGNIWYMGSGSAYSQNFIWSGFRLDEEPNFASRSLLGSPVTKTSSDFMRIAYSVELT